MALQGIRANWSENSYIASPIVNSRRGFRAFLDPSLLLPAPARILFVGYFVSKDVAADELGFESVALFKLWHFLLRYAVPPAVLVLFILGVTE